MERPAIGKIVAVGLVVLVVATSVVAAYVLYPRLSGTNQPSEGVQMLSYAFKEYPASASNPEAEVSWFFWVQNVAGKPITSLVGDIQGLPSVKFGRMDWARGYINQSNPLYPNEAGGNLSLRLYQTNQFVIGNQYSITSAAQFSDGSSVQTTEDFTVTNASLGFCGANVNVMKDSFKAVTVSHSVDNSTGEATLEASISARTYSPLVAVLLEVNSGSEWLPFDQDGSPISPSNTLSSGVNVTQTFTWTYLAGTTSSYGVLFVGSCADENGMTSVQVNL